MNEELHVRVKGGYIVATKSCDPDYPGIDVEFVADDDKGEHASRPRVLFEQPVETGETRALIWENKDEEDYTKEIVF